MLPSYDDSKALADSLYDIKNSNYHNITIHSHDKVLWKRNKKRKTNKQKYFLKSSQAWLNKTYLKIKLQ